MRAHHGCRHGRVGHGVRGLIGRGKGDPESGAVNNRRRKRGAELFGVWESTRGR